MSDVNKSSRVPAYPTPSVSFGLHRDPDRPASAMQAGASSMPQAWQTRNGPSASEYAQMNAPARSFGDIALDPVRWITASKPRMIGVGVFLAAYAITLLF